ncbi:hypothetical protein TNIN_494821 [Trichonephila inaurata madagascariensis]|uniref:Uncharacterized protein n=1 Tax=Trichonephila inaurata madagascariensis TaxID=2747483 RepID=A0A8X6XM93_9ARAC|nr:hypothetical protein TNIN_494821 [Trichonephila inaurata madagascariensis]
MERQRKKERKKKCSKGEEKRLRISLSTGGSVTDLKQAIRRGWTEEGRGAARTRWLLGPESDATLILLRQHHVEGGRREGDFLNPVPSECHWMGMEKLKRRKRGKNKKHSV